MTIIEFKSHLCQNSFSNSFHFQVFWQKLKKPGVNSETFLCSLHKSVGFLRLYTLESTLWRVTFDVLTVSQNQITSIPGF